MEDVTLERIKEAFINEDTKQASVQTVLEEIKKQGLDAADMRAIIEKLKQDADNSETERKIRAAMGLPPEK